MVSSSRGLWMWSGEKSLKWECTPVGGCLTAFCSHDRNMKTQRWPRTRRSGVGPGPGGWGSSGEKGSFSPCFRKETAVWRLCEKYQRTKNVSFGIIRILWCKKVSRLRGLEKDFWKGMWAYCINLGQGKLLTIQFKACTLCFYCTLVNKTLIKQLLSSLIYIKILRGRQLWKPHCPTGLFRLQLELQRSKKELMLYAKP